LDGKKLITWPAAIVMLSDEARGIKKQDDDVFIVYNRFGKPKQMKVYDQRKVIR